MGKQSKDIRELKAHAESQGWVVTPTKNGHLKWVSPAGAVVISPSTPSDWRSMKNHVAYLRRAGLHVAHKRA